MSEPFNNDDSILDVPFDAEEIDAILSELKFGKSAGHDSLQAEHLKYGGPTLRKWIHQICNYIVDVEHIPDSLKIGTVIPVYKGGGKDPLDANSCRGITVSSVFAKVLESLLKARLLTHFMERGIPHLNQTACRKRVSCMEATFSTLEVLSQHSQQNEKMYMCLYDLQKAFDSVQYPILFKRLYEAGVNGKSWRLMCSWYNQPRSRVKVNGKLPPMFTIESGVLQGSVLSPVLFLLVMDPLLHTLENSNLGPYISNIYAGAFAHADHLCTITSSQIILQQQIKTVQTFAEENGMIFNPDVLLVASSKPVSTVPCIKNCLARVGIQSSSESSYGSESKEGSPCFLYCHIYCFCGRKVPGPPVPKTFSMMLYREGLISQDANSVIPILLYGCENWILTDPLLDHLEAFQAEMGRRTLKLSKFHSALSTRLALRWPSLAARILVLKLVSC